MGNLTAEHYKAWAEELDLFHRVPVLTKTDCFDRRAAKDERGLNYIEFEEEYGPPEDFFADEGLGLKGDRRGKSVNGEPSRNRERVCSLSEDILEHYDDLYHPQDCAICKEPVNEGWFCLDGGEVYHRGCVVE